MAGHGGTWRDTVSCKKHWCPAIATIWRNVAGHGGTRLHAKNDFQRFQLFWRGALRFGTQFLEMGLEPIIPRRMHENPALITSNTQIIAHFIALCLVVLETTAMAITTTTTTTITTTTTPTMRTISDKRQPTTTTTIIANDTDVRTNNIRNNQQE